MLTYATYCDSSHISVNHEWLLWIDLAEYKFAIILTTARCILYSKNNLHPVEIITTYGLPFSKSLLAFWKRQLSDKNNTQYCPKLNFLKMQKKPRSHKLYLEAGFRRQMLEAKSTVYVPALWTKDRSRCYYFPTDIIPVRWPVIKIRKCMMIYFNVFI